MYKKENYRDPWKSAQESQYGYVVRKAIEGAESAGAKTELIHLYDLQYTGCVSCVLSASGTTESTTADA